MRYAVNSEQMKEIDNDTIKEYKIPALELMERAAKEVAAAVMNKCNKEDRIIAVCGPGNNGGDGVAAGRILFLQGYHAAVFFIGEEEKASPLMKQQLEMAKKLGVPIENSNKLHEYNIIIDALFGIGLSRDVSGVYEETIHEINQSGCTVFSVDVPSGISSDNGRVMKAAVRADYTITFGYQKIGLLLYPGAEYAGTVTVTDIGFPAEATGQVGPNTFYYEPKDLWRLPERINYSNKGTFGKVLIIAGSKGMSGAAFLSAKAAYRTGAGLVKVLTSKENRIILQTSLPEALFAAYDEEDLKLEELQLKITDTLDWASVIVIGPGLGQSIEVGKLLETVISRAKVPIIIDADAVNLLAGQLDRQSLNDASNRLGWLSSKLKENTILTPHLMELSRLAGISITEIRNNLIDTAAQCSYNNKLIYVVKDARTVVTQGNTRYINVSGNNGMATGGSGDVLTGIIAALIAQGMPKFDAVCLAVYIHGLAGDAAAVEKGTYSMMAGDIVDSIEKVLLQANTRKGKR